MKTNKIKLTSIALIISIPLLAGMGITSAFAQSHRQNPLTWGVKGGLTWASFYGDAVSDAKFRTGFTAGLFLNYRFNDYLGIQPEVIFNGKGAKVDNGTGTTEFDLGYLNVPLLLKVYIPTHSRVTPNIYAGPQIGILLDGESNNVDINNKLKDITYGLAFGVGFDFDIASSPNNFVRMIGLDVRYSLGLTDTFDIPGKSDVRNGVLSGSLVIGF